MSRTRRKQKVTLSKLDGTNDSWVEPNSTVTDYRTCYANVRSVSGNETRTGDEMEALANVVFEIDYPRQGRFPQAVDRVTYTDGDITRTIQLTHVERRDEDRREVWLYGIEVA